MFNIRNQLLQNLDALKAAGVTHVPIAQAPDTSAIDEARIELQTLRETVAGCDKCPELYSTRTQTVFGEGPIPAELCFVGEAPGEQEDRTGEPFVGPAGQLLNKIIAAMGMSRDEVYICNTLKCRPPNNKKPLVKQLNNCRGYFDRQLELLQPKVICCLGVTAAQAVLQTKKNMTELRGQWHELNGVPVMSTWHPAYILRLEGADERKAKGQCWEDMKKVLQKLGRPIPGAK